MAVPTTTVGQLQTLLLTWLDDPLSGYFDSATTLVWLNMAQREVQKQLVMAGENWYVKSVETLTITGQNDYLFPSDFLKEHRIEIVTSGYGTNNEVREPLFCITLNEQDNSGIQGTGQPIQYYIKKDRFTVQPAPAIQNQQIRLYYSYKIPDLVLTTDVPDVPEEFMEYVALLAAYNGFIKDDRAPENLNAKILEYKERLKQMADDRMQDASRHIVETEEYGLGSWVGL